MRRVVTMRGSNCTPPFGVVGEIERAVAEENGTGRCWSGQRQGGDDDKFERVIASRCFPCTASILGGELQMVCAVCIFYGPRTT